MPRPGVGGEGRRYPRSARVGELLREVVADELERLSDADDRLVLVTVTAVDPDPDLRGAKVFLSSISEEAAEALAENRVRLQAAVGRQSRLKRTPRLTFLVDPGVQTGGRVEEILRDLKQREARGGDDQEQ